MHDRQSPLNPWKRLSRRTAYENPWITVVEDQVIRPDGKPGIYGIVQAKKATGVVALDTDDNIYLVGQYRYPTEVYSWEIIEGGTEHGEEALDGAKRELKEEAGLVAGKWEVLAKDLQLSNCFSAELAYIYVATELTEVGACPDGDEALTVKKIPFQGALSLVMEGEITDAISVMAILLVAQKRIGK